MSDDVVIPGRGVIAEVDVSNLKDARDAVVFSYTNRFGVEAEGFVLRTWTGELVAYENRCPHWSVPLDREGNEFLDDSDAYIVCPMHGALFELDTGNCISGPCRNDTLRKFEVHAIDDDRVEIRNSSRSLDFGLS